MTARTSWPGNGRRVESTLAAVIVGGIIYTAGFLYWNSYLPLPFFYEPSDMYADWFNTTYWSHVSGAYDIWHTVYPPLTFLFLKVLSFPRCYSGRQGWDVRSGIDARDCDWLGLWAIWLIFFINVALVWYSFRKIDRGTALQRTICVALGFPMLDAIERGNVVTICFTCVILCFGPLIKSARARWAVAGLAINFKIYLVAAVVPLLLKRRWRWVECALISAVVVYLLSYAIFGSGSVTEIVDNIRLFTDDRSTSLTSVWYSSTYQSLFTLLDGDQLPMSLLIGSDNVDLLLLAIPTLQHLTQALIVTAMVATWLRPEAIPAYRLVGLGILMAVVTSEAGGYSQALFMFFVMMEPWKGIGRRWAIVACYVLAFPLDISLAKSPPVPRDTYFGGLTVFTDYSVTLGPFVRPLIIETIAMALALVTIREVWADIRHQGWAQRWRFRHDAPLLPWIRRPAAPGSSAAAL